MKHIIQNIIRPQILWALLLIASLVGCKSDELGIESKNGIRIKVNYPGETRTKALSGTHHEVRYFLADMDGNIINNVLSDYHADESVIVMEPLPLGEYRIFVLGYDKSLLQSGLQINNELTNMEQTWFEFSDQKVPVLNHGELFYANKTFLVRSEEVEFLSLDLNRVLSGVEVKTETTFDYLKNSIEDVELTFPVSDSFYNGMSVAGSYRGSAVLNNEKVSCNTNNAFYIMPQIGRDSLQAVVTVTTQNHQGFRFSLQHEGRYTMYAGEMSLLAVDLSSHPDAMNATTYVKWQKLDPNYAREILSRNEPPAVVTNTSLRNFDMKEIIQAKFIETDSVMITSYSSKPVKDIHLYMRVSGYNEPICIAVIDSLPGFGQTTFSPSFLRGKATYKTKSNDEIQFQAEQLEASKMTMFIDCQDAHYQKLKEIKCDWNISFKTYDGPQWREMRWLYAREWCVISQNMAYIFSSPEFKHVWDDYKSIMGADLYDNNKVTFTPQMYLDLHVSILKRRNLVTGITGIGGGLGGGSVWGVDHWHFYGHYSSFHGIGTIAHEFGHCLGYGHSSAIAFDGGRDAFQNFMVELHDFMNDTGRIPYLKSDRGFIDFHNPINQEFWHNGIQGSWLETERDTALEEYFRNNPLN